MKSDKLNKIYESLKLAINNGNVGEVKALSKKFSEEQERVMGILESNNKLNSCSVGELLSIFESKLPEMFRTDRTIVSKVMKTILEDKNLLSQFRLYGALSKYDGNSDPETFVNEAVELAKKDLSKKDLDESKKKLVNTLLSAEKDFGNEKDKSEFYESIDYLVKNDKKLNNLNEISKRLKTATDYLKEHVSSEKETTENLTEALQNLKEKMDVLNEEEKSLVDDIVSAKSQFAEERQSKFFNSLKEKCVEQINKVLSDENCTSDDKIRLTKLKEHVEGMTFNKNTVVSDTAKLLEVGSLMAGN